MLVGRGSSLIDMYQIMAQVEVASNENTQEIWSLYMAGAVTNKYAREFISPAFAGAILFDLYFED